MIIRNGNRGKERILSTNIARFRDNGDKLKIVAYEGDKTIYITLGVMETVLIKELLNKE